MSQVKSNDVLLNSVLLYVLLSAIGSIVILFIAIWHGAVINILAGITLLAATSIFLYTVYCSVNALKRIHLKRSINFILGILLIQSFAVFFPGFHFKFSGGFELIGFIVYTNLGTIDFGMFMSNFTYHFSLNGQNAKGYMISINLITVFLAILLIVLKKRMADFKL